MTYYRDTWIYQLFWITQHSITLRLNRCSILISQKSRDLEFTEKGDDSHLRKQETICIGGH